MTAPADRPSPPGSGSSPDAARLFAPAAERNRQPILEVLSRVLPDRGLVLEVASGSGEHARWFAQALHPLVWQPSDPDPASRRSIAGHAAGAAEAAGAIIEAPLDLDAAAADWPIARADAVVCINMIHISPWRAAEGLIAGASRILPPGGVLYLYGPYLRGGHPTAPSNAAFDASLRARNPDWGLRSVEAVTEAADPHGLVLSEVVDMPANNLSLVFAQQ